MSEQSIYFYQQIPKPGFLKTEDQRLVSTFQASSGFDYRQDRVELYIYSFDGSLLLEDLFYNRYRVVQEGSTRQDYVSTIELDPIEDAKFYSFTNGDVNLSYNFIRKITEDNELFIESISPDRTELILYSVSLIDAQLASIANQLSQEFKDASNLPRVVLKTGGETYLQVVNVGLQQVPGRDAIKVKLYEPLPPSLRVKANLALSRIVSEPVEFSVTRDLIFQTPPKPVLRGPNFNIEVQTQFSNPTDLLSENNIISGSSNLIYSKTGEVGAEINVDYSDYSSFVHFSSAQERLNNFQYKLSVIKDYEALGNTGSINSTLGSFDHYDRFLYYGTGSYSWPKTAGIPDNPTGSAAIAFFTSQSAEATFFDETNPHRLINTIPSFLREDPNNEPYNLFIDMIGQHFDNVWLYAKGMTDRYDGDNRVDYGISKDLVADALRGFGLKLYGSSANLDTLFNAFEGDGVVTGSEDINFAISASNDNISGDNYQKEIYKRIYHNIPLLLKSKGTDRGLRALLNVFGIPKNLLDIRYYGGQNSEITPFYGPFYSTTSSLDKVRIDNTGSIFETTLSEGTFIYQPDEKYTQDIHLLEVGFSPTDNVNRYIISQSLLGNNFDIDDYIGNPRLYSASSYAELDKFAESTFSGSITERYDLYDYVRLLKYYDNALFKMVKDFTPARTNVATGLIIKPHILERNKVKSVEVSFTQPEYSGSIEIGSIEAGDGGVDLAYVNAFTSSIELPGGGFGNVISYQGQAGITGEYENTKIVLTNGELNEDNQYKSEAYILSSSNSTFEQEFRFNDHNATVNNVDIASEVAYKYNTKAWSIPRYDGAKNSSTLRILSNLNSRTVQHPALFLDPFQGYKFIDQPNILNNIQNAISEGLDKLGEPENYFFFTPNKLLDLRAQTGSTQYTFTVNISSSTTDFAIGCNDTTSFLSYTSSQAAPVGGITASAIINEFNAVNGTSTFTTVNLFISEGNTTSSMYSFVSIDEEFDSSSGTCQTFITRTLSDTTYTIAGQSFTQDTIGPAVNTDYVGANITFILENKEKNKSDAVPVVRSHILNSRTREIYLTDTDGVISNIYFRV